MNKARRKRIDKNRIMAYLLVFFIGIQSFYISDANAAVENPWDGSTMSVPATDSDGVFLITTSGELAWFANQVNAGNSSINGRLENTIWLNDHDTKYEWIMIGDSEEHPYRGTFEGNGQRVNFLYTVIDDENPELRYGGLFGVIDGGTVSNLSVSGTMVHGYGNYGKNGELDELYSGTGGIAGYLKSGRIANCVNYTETVMDGETMYRNAGGIVGINSGSVIRCINNGKLSTDVVFAQRHVGGIAGMVYGPSAQVRYCENRGKVQGYYEVGGVAGAVKCGGEILASCNYAEVVGNSILGGIAGNVTKTGTYSNGSVKECVIRNVYNLGSISGITADVGTTVGGIIGQMGYESGNDEATPSLPILENAYATVQYVNETYTTRGAVIGYFKSGSIGNVYGMSGSGLEPCGIEESKSTTYTGSVQMKTETNLKSVSMINQLGSTFVKTNKYDYDNTGFPKLAWQGQTSDLAIKVDEAIVELNGWLTETNRLKYGAAYTTIETTVANYTEMLGQVVTDEDFEQIITQAREKLTSIKPGTEVDNDLAAAIDEGILSMEQYYEELLDNHINLTKEQMEELQEILNVYIQQLDDAENVTQVDTLVRTGKDALDVKVAEYEEEKRLEELRLNAISTLEAYRSESYGEPWDQQIAEARATGLNKIEMAGTMTEVNSALEEAKAAIDEIINQIPQEGAWDGTTMTEPAMNGQGVYQIGTGEELAWFANQVNTVSGMSGICGELTGDINLGNKSWTPIGGETVYQGSFDGNEHTIRGLNVMEADTYAGLFGSIYGDDNQSIVNLTVKGTIKCAENADFAGGIVGYIYGKNESQRNAIENCHSEVNITISKVTQNNAAVGGIAGYARQTWFRNCSNKGTVCIDSIGKGGIQYFVAGILGHAAASVSVRRCFNAGYVWAEFGAGGIVGKLDGANCEFTSNYNYGEVRATTYAGGLVGVLTDKASGSQVKWSYNSGIVNLNKSGEYVGALAGGVRTGSFIDVYALKRSEQSSLALVGFSSDNTAPGTFVSSEELKRDTMLNSLNGGGNYFIHDYLGFQNGYPIFSWQLTLSELKTGASTELQTFVSAKDYTEENWAIVQGLIAKGLERIQSAAAMDEVNTALTETRTAVYEVESKADAYAQQLQEAKDAAIAMIENYADLTLYREEERTKLELYILDATKRISLAETLEQVAEYLALAKDNMNRLPTEEQYLYEQNVAAAAQVDGYILNIGEVVYVDYVKTSINIARNAYDTLTDTQKALVTEYQTLLDAEAAYELLALENEGTEEDRLLAGQVDALIGAIGTVTLDSENAIQTARHAYDALTDLQKTLVQNPEALVAAENTYDELRAREVSAAIASIGEVTLDKEAAVQNAQAMYDALNDKQKALVTDHDALERAAETYVNLVAAQVVIDMIDQIGVVTKESGNVVRGAITAYNSLTGVQQSMVTNYYVLEQAAAEFDSLNAVVKVEEYINQIGTVTASSGSLIQKARTAYNALSDAQKSKVTNLSVLENAEKAYKAINNGNNGETTKPVGSVADAYKNNPGNGQGQNSANGTGSGNVAGKQLYMIDPETGELIFYEGNDADGFGVQLYVIDPETGEFVLYDMTGTDGSDGQLYVIDPETGKFVLYEGTGIVGSGAGDDYVPLWQESDDTTDAQVSADSTMAEMTRMAKRKENVVILGIVLGACAAVTTVTGGAMYLASRKRKAKRVRY